MEEEGAGGAAMGRGGPATGPCGLRWRWEVAATQAVPCGGGGRRPDMTVGRDLSGAARRVGSRVWEEEETRDFSRGTYL